jgi:acetylglutamate kinase
MKVVVKIGGTLLEDPASRRRMVAMVAAQVRAGHRVLLVHGGGKLLTAFLEKTGVKSEFLNGLRVTSDEAMDGVVKVFAGTVNHSLLGACVAERLPAAGISGIDAACLLAEKLRGEAGEDWGYVGKIVKADPHVWETLLAGGILPVMACLAVGADGQIYNVNADSAAVACATAWRADSLVFMTDVDGVLDGAKQRIAQLPAQEIPALLASGAVTAGMLAKLNAVREAVAGGVEHVHICNGHREGILGAMLNAAEGRAADPGSGTVIVAEKVASNIS